MRAASWSRVERSSGLSSRSSRSPGCTAAPSASGSSATKPSISGRTWACSGSQTTAGATVEYGSGSRQHRHRHAGGQQPHAQAQPRLPAAGLGRLERLARPAPQRQQQHRDDDVQTLPAVPSSTPVPAQPQDQHARDDQPVGKRQRRIGDQPLALRRPPSAAARCGCRAASGPGAGSTRHCCAGPGWAGRTGRTSRGRRRSAAAGCR